MKSATPKVLHRDRRAQPARARPAPLPALEPDHLAVVVGHGPGRRSPRTSAEVAAGRACRRRPGRAARHRPRRPGRARALPRRTSTGHRRRARTATSRCCRPRRSPALVEHARARRRRGHRAHRASVADPTGYGRIVRDADGAVAGDRRAAGRDRRAARRSPRSTRGIYAFDAGGPRATRCGRLGHRQRPGRGVPHRRRRRSPRADGRRVGALRRRTTCGRPRASTTGSSWPRSARELNRPDPRALDARGVDHRRPGDAPGSTSTSSSPRTSTLLPGIQLHGATAVGDGRGDRPGHARSTDIEVGAGAERRAHPRRAAR